MDKPEKIKEQLMRSINTIIDTADQRDSLDYFNIEISNHEGKISIEYKLKSRRKVY